MRQVILITGGVIAALSLLVAVFTFNQAKEEEAALTSRLQSRAQVIAESLADDIGPNYLSHATSSVQRTVDKFASSQRLDGLAVYDRDANVIAGSGSSTAAVDPLFLHTVMDSNVGEGEFASAGGHQLYVFAIPLPDNSGAVVGALATVQNADYIAQSINTIWWDNLARLLLQLVLIALAIYVLARVVFLRPVRQLTESIKAARRGEVDIAETAEAEGFLEPLTDEIAMIATSLRHARRVASEEARLRLEKIDSPWTEERLKEFIKAFLKDRPIFVVSNAEPYVHRHVKNAIECSVPAGGVITAIEPVMEACGGTWIAWGSGDADKEVADKNEKLRVPPEEPKYTLKRVFLTKEQRQGYYTGFSNDALWPLCHLAHVRPVFRAEDWEQYREVNELFAKTVLAEIRGIERPIILVQDYHLSLVPALIKKKRPDAQVALFWHIPWPSAAQFSICPWRKEILEGMLGADLLGFHTQQFCNNFMDTAAAEVESRIDYERFSVIRGGHETHVEPFPISIAFPGGAEIGTPPDRSILAQLGIRSEFLALGVDRLDYTKGIPERFRAVEFLLERHPEYRERFTLLQIGSPTRASAGKYGEYAAQVAAEAERINAKFGTRDWRPIVFEHKSYSHEALRKLYQLADVMLVTSLHDGMNLVSKEYVAARSRENGVLILSHFAGASRDLSSALIINPYSAEETAEAIRRALTMGEAEQHRRMGAMRSSVRDYNVYRWSAEIIRSLASQ